MNILLYMSNNITKHYKIQGGIEKLLLLIIIICLDLSLKVKEYKSMIIFYSSNLEQSIFTNNDLPSSYESYMQNNR